MAETRGVRAFCSWELFSLYAECPIYNRGSIGDAARDYLCLPMPK